MLDYVEFMAECHKAKKLVEVIDAASTPVFLLAAAAAIIIIAKGVNKKESRR